MPTLVRIDEVLADPFLPRATFALQCDVCKAIAVRFGAVDHAMHMLVFDRREGQHQAEIWEGERATKLAALLDSLDARAVIDFLTTTIRPPGCEAYCPDCDRVYCWNHFRFRNIEWGEWAATCPSGHERELH